jgi:integrase
MVALLPRRYPAGKHMRLTARTIENLQPAADRREIPDALLVGLYCVIHPTGKKVWAVRYRHHGINRKLTLGPYPAINLKHARELAAKALRAVAEGRDPGLEKIQAHADKADSIESVVEKFIERHYRRTNRPKTAHRAEQLLRLHVLPRWRARMVGDITRRDVRDVLDRVVDSGAPIQANRVLAVVRKLFNWCVAHDILTVSPCTGVEPPTAERSRDRVLDDNELRLVWQTADKIGYPHGPLVQLLALTGQRRDEVGQMRWAEVDIEKRLWTLPPERVKNRKPHEVPLSEAALAILTGVTRIDSSPFVFTFSGASPATGFSKAKRKFDALLPADMPAWRLHDMRRTVASGLARLRINLPVIEKVLNHTSGSFAGIVGVYQKHSFADEKRHAVEAWGRHVELISEKRS